MPSGTGADDTPADRQVNSLPVVRPARSSMTFLVWVAWTIVAAIGAIAATQVVRWNGGFSVVAAAQALTPYLGLLLVPVLVGAFWKQRYTLTTVAAATGFVLLVVATPLVFPGRQPRPIEGADGLRVAAVNLWYGNDHVADVAEELADVDADVVVFGEFTSAHQAVLRSSTLATSYPNRLDMGDGGASGIAVWSKWAMRVDDPLPTELDSIDVTVAGPDGDVRVVGVHMPTPISDFAAWRRDHELAVDIARTTDRPTLLIGDLNTSYWHPDFRDMLDAGWVDAHIALGDGFSTSWPTTWIVPPFVRLDRALTTGGLVSTDVDDVEIPGSDHHGIVVSVAPAR